MQNIIPIQAPARQNPTEKYAAEIITLIFADEDCESINETMRAAGYAQ